MGRFSFEDAEKYGGNGGNSFFSLANDKDTAQVRFMYDSMEDVQGYAVHEVKIGDKRRYVNCIRSYDEPMNTCPFCSSGKTQLAKIFVPLYDVATGQVKIWERGRKFFGQLSSLCSRYPHLVSHIVEIERNGKKGDTGTTYQLYEINKDETTFDNLPEVPNIIGGLVLDKSADEMRYFLDYGDFPNDDTAGSSERSRSSHRESEPIERRTPINRRGADAF